MRRLLCCAALFASCCATGAQADLQTISFVQLATAAPQADTALYQFSFVSNHDGFVFGRVYFNLQGGVRYGCGVYVGARCTLNAAGQTLRLIGLTNGIEGSFSWNEDPAGDNRPTGISFGVPLPGSPHDFESSISLVTVVPEPASWAMMVAGFGLLGTGLRQKRRAGPPGRSVPFA